MDRGAVHPTDHLGEVEQPIDMWHEPGVVVLGCCP
jgi:hypothetical protein